MITSMAFSGTSKLIQDWIISSTVEGDGHILFPQ
jgi:hypothetical protein